MKTAIKLVVFLFYKNFKKGSDRMLKLVNVIVDEII